MKATALLTALLIASSSGFSPLFASTARQQSIKIFASESSSSFQHLEEPGDATRRNLFLSSLSCLLLSGSGSLVRRQQQQRVGQAGIDTTFFSIDQAMDILESSCDRRFLHAVVASDYHLLYKQASSTSRKTQNQIYIDETQENLLELPNRRRQDAFLTLEEKLRDRPLQPSTSRLGFANPKTEAAQSLISVWPLGNNVHFAWMQEGTAFESISSEDKVIVDGIDCGRMSLEDALEGGKHILFRSDRYLAVPISMETELIERLKSAFLI